jgi:hypothetical protein
MRTSRVLVVTVAAVAVGAPAGFSPSPASASNKVHHRAQSFVRHDLAGLRSGPLVVFILRRLRGCTVSFARVHTVESGRALAVPRVKDAVKRGLLIVRVRGRHPSLDIGCASVSSTTRSTTAAGARAGGGNGTLLFDGTFGSSNCSLGTCPNALANWPNVFGSCYRILSPDQVEFDVTSSCDPAGDGNYRTDLCSSHNCDHNLSRGDFYVAGRGTCTSIPIRFPDGLGTIPYYGWFQFAETKDNEAWGSAGWEMDVSSQLDGVNRFAIAFQFYDGGDAWYGGTIDTGWHTLSVCTNNADNDTGEVWSIWFDGVRQAFNQGPDAGAWSVGGFPIIYDGTTWPLDINDYTGLADGYDPQYPYPAVVIHGAPLISSAGPDSLPPEPPRGWNSP